MCIVSFTDNNISGLSTEIHTLSSDAKDRDTKLANIEQQLKNIKEQMDNKLANLTSDINERETRLSNKIDSIENKINNIILNDDDQGSDINQTVS